MRSFFRLVEGDLFLRGDCFMKPSNQPVSNLFIEFAVIMRRGDRRTVYRVSRQVDHDLVARFPHLARHRQNWIFSPGPYPAKRTPSQVSDNAVIGSPRVQGNSNGSPHVLVHAEELAKSLG